MRSSCFGGRGACGGDHPVSGVHSGYRSRGRKEEWVDVFIQESLRDQLRMMASRYTRLRAAVQNWAMSRGLENEGKHLHEMLREVGRWPE